jgi:hypothetical protein
LNLPDRTLFIIISIGGSRRVGKEEDAYTGRVRYERLGRWRLKEVFIVRPSRGKNSSTK